ncbi:hypothetical protein, partial [Escherichia coli]|uniref:hypothetical protein n=4 Tax=Enterobacteriaceae TaxID=543 RepID=UPI001BE40114
FSKAPTKTSISICSKSQSAISIAAKIFIHPPIYHNIRYQHPLTGPQRNSDASEPFPAHFLTHIPEKRP